MVAHIAVSSDPHCKLPAIPRAFGIGIAAPTSSADAGDHVNSDGPGNIRVAPGYVSVIRCRFGCPFVIAHKRMAGRRSLPPRVRGPGAVGPRSPGSPSRTTRSASMQPNQFFGAGTGTTTTVSPPGLPLSPLGPSAPDIPGVPAGPGAPVAPGGPGTGTGTAGPGTGTGTTAGGEVGAGTTTVGRSHALSASADIAATTTIEYFMMIPRVCRTRTERGIAATARARNDLPAYPT